MIYKFEVEGFKGFEHKLSFDLSHQKNYEFNQECIRNGVVRKSIVYGKNGIGKSNLGLALFDIVSHLTDYNMSKALYGGYVNAKNETNLVKFKYEFKFHNEILIYSYEKENIEKIISESIIINDKIVASYDRRKGSSASFGLSGTETLNTNMSDSPISIVRYIKNNAVINDDNIDGRVFNEFISFVDKMLFFRSLDSNRFFGIEMKSEYITPDIVKKGNVADFERFLNEAGVDCKLCVRSKQDGEEVKEDIYFDFGERKIPFYTVASTGTKALALFYFWLQRIKSEGVVSFVFIDEFDAFYHHALSMLIVKEMKTVFPQVIMTTHNTSIMSNDLLRPDCFFLMENNSIEPIYKKTDKELREAHNIEKMYKAGAFND
ncbi:AAA family ATPase [Pectobacterium polaris]|uniref:AAA family ATPase n=1 Tax=Pectobacterium polaris TaxID=2042057 RepID=UPI00202D4F7D|nr:ATP-binding protein [Pectobacterium polaris]MCL6326879.1 ATP-binding protein [Pectobacterium polaris]